VAQVGTACTKRVTEILIQPTGLPFHAAEVLEREGIQLGELSAGQVMAQNVAFELAERTTGVKYPCFYVYCEKITNQLREKFRTFSGKARMVVDVRVSKDHLESLDGELQSYVEAVTRVLDSQRGNWEQGIFFGGAYEVAFGSIKHGGRNYVQSARVVFDLDVSAD
jgi:hypothetical protein